MDLQIELELQICSEGRNVSMIHPPSCFPPTVGFDALMSGNPACRIPAVTWINLSVRRFHGGLCPLLKLQQRRSFKRLFSLQPQSHLQL